jgi:hypothetical protein
MFTLTLNYSLICVNEVCNKLQLHANKDIGAMLINDTLKKNIKTGTQLFLSEFECGKNVENIHHFAFIQASISSQASDS